jgi:hypothetical protein
VAVAVVIGVMGAVRVRCLRVPKSQVLPVVLVVVLVAVFPIHWAAMLQLKLCLLAQSLMETRAVTQSAELTTTALAEVAQVLLARIGQPQTSCPLRVELV